MSNEDLKQFKNFAGQNGDYYAEKFLQIQKSILPRTHINYAALLGSFVWAGLRGNWLLFTIGLVIDLVAMVNLALYFKYSDKASEYIGQDDKVYLLDRYEDWSSNHILMAIATFVLGRILFAWLADRFYANQYARWRTEPKTPSSFLFSRLITVAVVSALILPLTIYRSTQFVPEQRACIKQDRLIESGEQVAFQDRFNCAVMGEFPTLIWIDRPDTINYRKDDSGKYVEIRTAAREGAPPFNLNKYMSQTIDDSIQYATVFYGSIFDQITAFLNSMLNAIEAVFVGTPWPVTMMVLVFIAYKMAGPRTAIFAASSLVYIALFDFWQTAMDTMSLVVASTIICTIIGLPLGIWVGKSDRGNSITTPILDVMQTIPSFVYLLPAIAFFSIGKPPAIMATVIFAMPPMVRLTALGIKHVPENTKEAALAFGANPRQLLTKVELPLALPSIMAGMNQVVMMSLAMVVIAAFIGAGGMGFIVVEALNNAETGRGLLAGFGIALLAMMIDSVVQKANKIRD